MAQRAITLHIDLVSGCLRIEDFQRLATASVEVCRSASPNLSPKRNFLRIVKDLGGYLSFLQYFRLTMVSSATFNRPKLLLAIPFTREAFSGPPYSARGWEFYSSDEDLYDDDVSEDSMPLSPSSHAFPVTTSLPAGSAAPDADDRAPTQADDGFRSRVDCHAQTSATTGNRAGPQTSLCHLPLTNC